MDVRGRGRGAPSSLTRTYGVAWRDSAALECRLPARCLPRQTHIGNRGVFLEQSIDVCATDLLGRVNHGTRRAYDAHGCRCAACTTACNSRQRELRTRRGAEQPEDNPLLAHGTKSTYVNHRCRCPECVDAQRAANRRRYA